MARRRKTPLYRHHRASDQAVVTINGRDHYMGNFGSERSHEKYQRLIPEWSAGIRHSSVEGESVSHDLSIVELIAEYWRHCDSCYRKHGKASSEIHCLRSALRPLRRIYGNTLAREFGPLRLLAVRKAMIDAGLARTTIDSLIRRIQRTFKWATKNEMVPRDLRHGLAAVDGLRRGEGGVREPAPIEPVPDADIEPALKHTSRQVAAMARLQLLRGMRSQEVLLMRGRDLDMSGPVWMYQPQTHKTEDYEETKEIDLGPRAQEVIRPFLKDDMDAYIFSPIDADAERRAASRANRKSRLTPSQSRRRPKRRPRRTPKKHYTND